MKKIVAIMMALISIMLVACSPKDEFWESKKSAIEQVTQYKESLIKDKEYGQDIEAKMEDVIDELKTELKKASDEITIEELKEQSKKSLDAIAKEGEEAKQLEEYKRPYLDQIESYTNQLLAEKGKKREDYPYEDYPLIEETIKAYKMLLENAKDREEVSYIWHMFENDIGDVIWFADDIISYNKEIEKYGFYPLYIAYARGYITKENIISIDNEQYNHELSVDDIEEEIQKKIMLLYTAENQFTLEEYKADPSVYDDKYDEYVDDDYYIFDYYGCYNGMYALKIIEHRAYPTEVYHFFLDGMKISYSLEMPLVWDSNVLK